MIKGVTALRYSKALFKHDLPNKLTKQRVNEFEYLLKTFEDNPKLVQILHAPQIKEEEKRELLTAYLKEIKDPYFLNFLFYLINQGRLESIKQIAVEYEILTHQMENIWDVHLVTSVKAQEELKNELKSKLEKFYKKTIHLTEEIDPQILGGALLKIGNQVMDWSVKTRIKKLKEHALTENKLI